MAAADTIAAVATATGRGGVGIIRVSGPEVAAIAQALIKQPLQPRHAHYTDFCDDQGEVLDRGIALYFPAPHSFTGEDVLELQGHGGPVVLDLLLARITRLGARLARPGEFSERAFLNDKLDLAQAEAIADLIDACTEQAARNALHSLQGAFSRKVNELLEALIQLRIYVESAIDFPEEEIDFLGDGKIAAELDTVLEKLNAVLKQARQGALVRDGMTLVIAGRPNAGKSSLLNALSGRDSAIVTPVEGTTRDLLREQIHIDGMPLHIIDTAGLRESPDPVEQIGIDRAWQEIAKADRVLMLVDSQQSAERDPARLWPEFVQRLPDPERLTLVRNKIDLNGEPSGPQSSTENTPLCLGISAATGEGLDALREHLKTVMGYRDTGQSGFTARRRHLDALQRAKAALETGREQLHTQAAGELLAEDLRQAQNALGEITGSFTPDDLLGRIFSSFCIGK